MPFLENVTRGRGIPRERLEEVGEHYHLFGGRSPINDLNRDLLAAVRADLAGAGIDLPGLLGQPQLGPLPHRRARRDARRRRHPGRVLRDQRLLVVVELPAVPREPVRRRRAARRRARRGWTSCGTTSTTPGSSSRWSTRSSRRSPSCPTTSGEGAHLVFVTHSIPVGDERRAAGPTAAPTSRQHLDVAAAVAARVAAETGHAPRPRRSSTARARGRRRCRGSSRTSTTTSTRAGRRRARRAWCWSRSGSSPTTWRSSTTSTPRRSRPPRELELPAVRAATPQGDPRFVAMVRDLLLERAAAERGEPVDAAERRRRSGRCGTSARWAAAPTRAATGRRCAGADSMSERAARRRASTPPGPPPRSSGDRSRGEVTVAATKSSDVDVVTEADRAAERLIRERIAGSPPRRRVPGRGGRRRAGLHRRALGRRPDRRHRQLPLRPPAVRRVDRRRGRRRGGRRRGPQRRDRASSSRRTPTRTASCASRRDGEPIRVRATAPLAQRLVSTGFGYDARPARAARPRALVRLLPQVRDIRRLGSCALDLCHVAEGTLDGYVEEGVNLWDHAAGGAGRAGRRGHGRGHHRGRRRHAWCCARPADGFDELRTAVAAAGYLAAPAAEETWTTPADRE